MTEANKNTLKEIGYGLVGFTIFCLIAFLVPDDSIFKKIFGYIILAVLVFCVFYFTGLGNPIKRLIRRIQEKNKK